MDSNYLANRSFVGAVPVTAGTPRSQKTKLLRLQRAGRYFIQRSERSVGIALEVLHEQIAELLYARIETPARLEQYAYRASHQASHVLSNRELAAKRPS